MGATHIVKQGECLTAIAARYGFEDIKGIYEAPENAEFRELRPNPDMLLPGDRIFIPDRQQTPRKLATGQRHKIVVKQPKRRLRLKLQLAPGDSLEGEPFELRLGGQVIAGQVAGGNLIEADIPPDADMATLLLEERDVQLQLAIGHLDPIRDGDGGAPVASGVQARLHNLGFSGRSTSGAIDDETTTALRRFQAAALGRTDPDGTLDDETIRKLTDEHGC
jgi:N-acetylmuramoyl-L-alanine amidase